jgi:hypothetical protein
MGVLAINPISSPPLFVGLVADSPFMPNIEPIQYVCLYTKVREIPPILCSIIFRYYIL